MNYWSDRDVLAILHQELLQVKKEAADEQSLSIRRAA
jgi:hypothetical protein